MSVLFHMLSRLVISFLPRSKHLLISWLQSPSAVVLQPVGTQVSVSTVAPTQSYLIVAIPFFFFFFFFFGHVVWGLVTNRKRSMSRLYIVTLLI